MCNEMVERASALKAMFNLYHNKVCTVYATTWCTWAPISNPACIYTAPFKDNLSKSFTKTKTRPEDVSVASERCAALRGWLLIQALCQSFSNCEAAEGETWGEDTAAGERDESREARSDCDTQLAQRSADAHVFRDFLVFARSPGSHKGSDVAVCVFSLAPVGETGCLALNRIKAVKAHTQYYKTVGKGLLSFFFYTKSLPLQVN